MAGSRTSIINMALVEIGEPPITDPLDDSEKADACNAIYDDCVEETLQQHAWNCATKRAVLAAVTGEPLWGDGISYELPVDCLRVLGTVGGVEWKVEGRMLYLPSGGTPAIVYVAKVIDESLLTPLLRRAIAMRIASGVAVRLKGSHEAANAAFQKWKDAIAEAMHKDAIESGGQAMWPMEYVRAHETGATSFPGGGD